MLEEKTKNGENMKMSEIDIEIQKQYDGTEGIDLEKVINNKITLTKNEGLCLLKHYERSLIVETKKFVDIWEVTIPDVVDVEHFIIRRLHFTDQIKSEGRMLQYYRRKADDLYLEKILHKLKPHRGSLAYKDLSKKESA
tara:strand:- start:1907 stop:2323 length:417 start_codon:yes stop_codon:yes gene_type:complete